MCPSSPLVACLNQLAWSIRPYPLVSLRRHPLQPRRILQHRRSLQHRRLQQPLRQRLHAFETWRSGLWEHRGPLDHWFGMWLRHGQLYLIRKVLVSETSSHTRAAWCMYLQDPIQIAQPKEVLERPY
jgi:hypothetical protein